MVLVSDKPINTIVLTSLIILITHFLHAGRQRDTLPGTEEPMITIEFITALLRADRKRIGKSNDLFGATAAVHRSRPPAQPTLGGARWSTSVTGAGQAARERRAS